MHQLVLAADQFIVSRPLPDEPNGKTIIAGYHWFSDWGRDTMISLPGLTISVVRPELARPNFAYFEIFDGDEPLSPRGCIAQAWTVTEVLCAWIATEPTTENSEF